MIKVDVLEIVRGSKNKRILTVSLEEAEASKFCERFNKINVPQDSKARVVGTYLHALPQVAGFSFNYNRLVSEPQRTTRISSED